MTSPSQPEQPVTYGQVFGKMAGSAARATAELVVKHAASLVLTSVCGDYRDVAASARGSRSVRMWSLKQNLQASLPLAGVGALTAVRPDLALPASLGGTLWVTRRMAHTVWGIGTIQRKNVEPVTDLIGVWALMSGTTMQKLNTARQSVETVAYQRWQTLLNGSRAPITAQDVQRGLAIATALLKALDEDRFVMARKMVEWAAAHQAAIVPIVGGALVGAGTSLVMSGVSNNAQTYYSRRLAL